MLLGLVSPMPTWVWLKAVGPLCREYAGAGAEWALFATASGAREAAEGPGRLREEHQV